MDTTIAGKAKPISQALSQVIPEAPAAPPTILSAASETGMGTYDSQPAFSLQIPASTYAAAYTSTMTVTVVSGP